MLDVDTSKVEVRQINKTVSGLFATQDIAAGEVVLVEKILVFESMARQNPQNIPDVVELACRIWADDHFDSLIELGFRPSVWTLPPTKEDKRWINLLLKKGIWNFSKSLALDCYKIAAGYNICVYYQVFDYISTGNVIISGRRLISHHTCMINHSCEPNTESYPITSEEEIKQRVQGVIALRDIKEGDEITIGYISDVTDEHAAIIDDPNKRREAQPLRNLNVKKRRARLKKLYGFNCSCSRCRRESGA